MAQPPSLLDRITPLVTPAQIQKRRRKKRSQQQNGLTTTQSPPREPIDLAQPSNTQSSNREPETPPEPSSQTLGSVPSSSQKDTLVSPNQIDLNEDYIAFLPSDSENDGQTRKSEKSKGKEPVRESDEREWDRGKQRERSRERGDRRKRNRDSMDLEDRHMNGRRRIDTPLKKAPWVYDIEWDECKNVSEMLHREVEAFTKWISPTPVEDEIRELTVEIISRAVAGAFPDAKVMPFGSYETKLYLPSGDIDLVIVSDSMAFSNKVSVLRALASVLKRTGITSNVTVIAKAKVPIVKFVTTHGRLNVDISINQINGVVGGQVVKGFLESMAGNGLALRSLVLITKLFLSQRSMNEVFTGGLGSYSIVCLAISFLQMHPKIRRGEIDTEKNLGVLVMEFFELYGCHFNYDEVGISVREGGTYFNKRIRGWYDLSRRSALSIEDPIDPNNDISSGSYAFGKVRATLAGAYGILTSTAYHHAAILDSRRRGRSLQLRREYHPEDLSVLAGIMGISQETINHRRLIQEVYDKRVLHNILRVKPRALVVHDQSTVPDQQLQQSKAPPPKEAYSPWKDAESKDMNIADETTTHSSDHHDHDAEESGKYDIGRQPPKKRRRMGREKDAHTVFIADDDDDSYSEDDKIEERVYPAGEAGSSGSKPASSSDLEKKRSYWLSKGIGLGNDMSDDYT